MSAFGGKRTFLQLTTMSAIKLEPSIWPWPAMAVRYHCRQSTQRHFEPFCFFLQADQAQFAYQPRPIMRYLRGTSYRNFFVYVSHAICLCPRMRKRLTHYLGRVGKQSFLQGLRERTFDVGQIVLPAKLSCASQ